MPDPKLTLGAVIPGASYCSLWGLPYWLRCISCPSFFIADQSSSIRCPHCKEERARRSNEPPFPGDYGPPDAGL